MLCFTTIERCGMPLDSPSLQGEACFHHAKNSMRVVSCEHDSETIFSRCDSLMNLGMEDCHHALQCPTSQISQLHADDSGWCAEYPEDSAHLGAWLMESDAITGPHHGDPLHHQSRLALAPVCSWIISYPVRNESRRVAIYRAIYSSILARSPRDAQSHQSIVSTR